MGWVTAFVTAGLLGAGVAPAAEDTKPTRVPVPTVNIEKGDKCVEPIEIMRRDHMNFILHQRDETVHKGIRTKNHSLINCINCHANPETNSVVGKDGFCESCHTYAAVTMDCFSCHSASPEKGAAAFKAFEPNRNERLKQMVHIPAVPAKRTAINKHVAIGNPQ